MSKKILLVASPSIYAVLIAVFLLGMISPVLKAQTSGTGGLSGTVTDPSGAAIPNATVTVTGNTGQQRVATTSQTGAFVISLLPPGDYHVKFEAAGFKTSEIPSATVTVTETATLDQRLQVGAQTQEVTITGDVETVQTTTSTLGTVVNSTTVVDLPLSTRNYVNLISMSAGANSNVYNATGLGKDTSPTAVNGADTSQNNFQLDGVSVDNWLSFGTGIESNFYSASGVPSPDAIAEFKIQTSTYDAGYGRNSGANVNVVTKSGTNEFHGTAFEFFRNTVLNSNDWFFKRNEFIKGTKNSAPVLDQNQYGGVFGGPAIKNKLFFFASYQETGQKNGFAATGFTQPLVPPIPILPGGRGTCPAGWTTLAQCDAATAAFVPALAAAMCPTGGSPGTTGNQTRALDTSSLTAVGGINILCAPTVASPLANLNPVAISIYQLKLANGQYYVPSSGGVNYALEAISDPARYEEHQAMGNIDYVIDSKNTLSTRYFYATDPQENPFPSQAVQGTGAITNTLPGTPSTNQFTNHAALIKLTSIITPNLVNELRGSYQRNLTNNHISEFFTNSQVGITPLGIDLLSLMTFGSAFILGNQGFNDVRVTENQFEYADQVSWTHGKHAIRAGFEVERVQPDIFIPGLSIGQPSFATVADFLIGRASCAPGTFPATCNTANPGNTNGTAQSSSITGGPGGTSDDVGDNGRIAHEFRATDLDGFIQDDIKISSHLTINAGLRWEYDGEASETHGRFSTIWPALINQVPVPPPGGTLVGFIVPGNWEGAIPTGVAQSNINTSRRNGPPLDNWAPRLGIAWQPLNSSRWVVRAGGGFFYERVNGDLSIDLLYNSQPYQLSPTPAPSATLAVPYVLPPTVPGPPGSIGWTPRTVNITGVGGGGAATSSNIATPSQGPFFVTPLLYEWNLTTQYEFVKDWVLEVGYVGSHGIHEASGTSGGGAPVNTAEIASPTNPLHCGYDGNPADCVTVTNSTNTFARVPYLGFSPSWNMQQGTGTYKFNSIQATLRKRFSHGLQMQAAYTYAAAFTHVVWGLPGSPATNPGYIYERNPQYRPQRFILNYSWDIPFPRPQSFILGKLAEGWTVSGVTTIQNGVPLNITDSRGGGIYGFSGSAPQFCAGKGPGNVATGGSVEHRVLNGLSPINGPGWFNGQASAGVFCSVPLLDGATAYGNAGPGMILGPPQQDWDISLIKTTKVGGIREDATLQFRTEFYNAFNHPIFQVPTLNVASGTAGQIAASAVNPRLIQFALKYSF